MSETRYARSGEFHIAFQVMGDGPVDLVYVPGLGVASRARAGKRAVPTLLRSTCVVHPTDSVRQARQRDVGSGHCTQCRWSSGWTTSAPCSTRRTSRRASLFGYSEGGTMAAMFAAKHPERVEKLVLFASHAGKVTGSPDFPCGYEAEPRIRWLEDVIETRWGTGDSLEHLAPTLWRHRQADRARAGHGAIRADGGNSRRGPCAVPGQHRQRRPLAHASGTGADTRIAPRRRSLRSAMQWRAPRCGHPGCPSRRRRGGRPSAVCG